MFEKKKYIEEGDVVIFYTGSTFKAVQVISRENTPTKYGVFDHSDIIGKEFGTKIYSRNHKGFVHVLRPSPYLWSLAITHRTQIMYSTDISLIILKLGISKNKVVMEAGTGSGCLTHAIAFSIRPHGKLYTFDFHEERFKAAKGEIEKHGLADVVSCNNVDVCTNGFQPLGQADAVVLDLPKPWEAIPSAKCALKVRNSSRICIFSPCIEQIQKSIEILNIEGFTHIEVMECLGQPMLLKQVKVPSPFPTSTTRKRKLPESQSECKLTSPSSLKAQQREYNTPSSLLCDTAPLLSESEGSNDLEAETAQGSPSPTIPAPSTTSPLSKVVLQKSYISPVPLREMPGHTGYLLFAILRD